MITIPNLTDKDKGRKVIYGRDGLPKQEGELTSWNDKYVFVKFKGPAGEACDPGDVAFAFDHCTIDNVGLKITGKDAQLVVELLNKYLHDFAATDGDCPQCGAKLCGLFGTFAWGLVNGEGICTGGLFQSGKCNWPCRAIHRPTFEDGGEIFEQALTNVLPYHPDFVNAKPSEKPMKVRFVEKAWSMLAANLRLPPESVQHIEMKRAFFAGAYTVMGAFKAVGTHYDEDKELEDIDFIESIWQECEAFRTEVTCDPEQN